MSEESTQISPDDSHVAINFSQNNEELIHKAEDAQW
jgi:DNA-binding MurR/RpiR family transcriptional regulator